MATRTRRTKPAFTIRTVATKEDRKRPSVFMRLKTDEAFKGYALFEPDPELADNPGYFEYYDHYDKQGNAYVPCTGENCPFCAANDNPSTRALTAWYFPQAADVKDQVKVFTMNFSTTQEMSDEAEDEGGVLGKMVRVKRLSDKGDYRVKITTDKPLTKAQIKEAMKTLDEKFKDGLPGLVMRQLEVQMERLKALDAMDDDEDEDEREERTTKARRGKAASRSTRDDDEDEDDEDEDEDEDESGEIAAIEDVEFKLLSVSKANNSVTVTHDGEKIVLTGDEDEIDVSGWKKGDTAVISAEYDEDEEGWVLTTLSEVESDEDEDEDEDDEDEDAEADEDDGDEDEDEDEDGDEDEDEDSESTAISGVVYEVVRVEEADEILHLKNDDGRVKMWVGDGVNPDYDEVKKGASVKVDAQQDEEGDWIVMSVELAKAPRTRKTTAAKTTTTRSRTTRKR